MVTERNDHTGWRHHEFTIGRMTMRSGGFNFMGLVLDLDRDSNYFGDLNWQLLNSEPTPEAMNIVVARFLEHEAEDARKFRLEQLERAVETALDAEYNARHARYRAHEAAELAYTKTLNISKEMNKVRDTDKAAFEALDVTHIAAHIDHIEKLKATKRARCAEHTSRETRYKKEAAVRAEMAEQEVLKVERDAEWEAEWEAEREAEREAA